MKLGYVSNGFADHTLEGMAQVLHQHGYDAIGITLDHHHLDPTRVTPERVRELQKLLQSLNLHPVVETGARYLLDVYRKHWPNLMSQRDRDRQRRVEFYRRSIDIAAQLGATVVSLWSGCVDDSTAGGAGNVCSDRMSSVVAGDVEGSRLTEQLWDRLCGGLSQVLDHAADHGVLIGFEPEPGMFVESMQHYVELRRRLPHPALKLTLDLGHLQITEEPPLSRFIEPFAADIVNVHVEDIQGRIHQHLPLGEGDLELAPLLDALVKVGYSGVVSVELSRNSHDAPHQARQCRTYLDAWFS